MQLKLALKAFADALLARNSQESIEQAIEDLHDKLNEQFGVVKAASTLAQEPSIVPTEPAPAPAVASEPQAPAQDPATPTV